MSQGIVLYGSALIIANVFALAMLPRTEGFTQPIPTLLCAAGFMVTAWALSRLVYSGMQLSILMPVAAAVIPLATIAMGILVYGESASIQKIGLLVIACGFIGLAARV